MKPKLYLAGFSLLLASCGNPEANLPSSTSTNGGASSTCGESVVDYGQKGVVVATVRGVYSDVAMIPGTSYPAMAYTDAGAIGVKATYWNGSSFSSEMVSAGTATFVKLVFLSNGRPAVFWTTGGTQSVVGAFRSAAFGTAGTWTVGVLDTVATTSRSLDVAVSPLDEIGIVYLQSATAATARARFLYCDAPCTSPGGFQNMAATTDNIENVNLTATHMTAGIAWCKASSSDYYPAVVYNTAAAGAAAGVRYAVCRQSDMANCRTAAGWTKQTVDTTASLLTSDLYIDPTVTGDVPKVITKVAGGLKIYEMGTTACTAAPAAFSAGSTIGGANVGTAWAVLMKDSAGKFHIAANESTTNVRYYNSQTTSILGAWNTVGNVESFTFNAVTATSAGAAVAPSGNKIYISYGGAAAPFNNHLATVGDYTVASSAATFSVQYPETTGHVLMSAAPIRNIGNAITSTGRAAVAYVDYSVGALTGAKLKYAIRGGTSATSSWTSVQIPGPSNPQFPSLAFDGDNKPWISFFDQTVNRFYLATNSSVEGTGSWSIHTMPIVPSGTYALPAANETAIAMYKSGGSSYPVMLALDSTNANTTAGLKSAMFTPSTSTWSNVRDASPVFTLGASDGNALSADFDSNGNIVAAFWDITTTRLNYFHTSNGGSTWTTAYPVTAPAVGEAASVRINPVTGYPALAYFDRANNRLYYNACSSSPSSCASGGWSETLLDPSTGVSGLSTSTGQVLGTGIGFDSSGAATVGYSTGQSTHGSLRTCTANGSNFSCATVSNGAGGNTPSAAAVNYGVSGWAVHLARTALGGLVANYIGPGGWLYQYGCN